MNNQRSSIPTALTLLFAPGHRPDAAAVQRIAMRPAETTKFMVSHLPEQDEGWLELLAMGLTFDVSGLGPGSQAPAIPAEHFYGIDQSVLDPRPEALRVIPGPHLSGGTALLPVIRVLAGLGAELARLPGLRAVGWDTSRSWMAPAYFMSAIRAWLVGGAFPSLALTAIARESDGAMVSDGLRIFSGFEARIEPLPGESAQATAKLAARMIDIIVQSGESALDGAVDQQGHAIHHAFSKPQGKLRIWREV